MDPVPVIAVRLLDGRVGSTLLMQLLATSDEVVLERRYPEGEFRYLSYCLRIAEWVATPWNPKLHPGVTELLFGPADLGGPLPFSPSLVDIEHLGRTVLEGMWRAFSEELRRSSPRGRYYAEKVVGDAELLLETAIPLRLVDLVRDPRDIYCSIRSRSGGTGFGRLEGQSDDEFLEAMVATQRQRLMAMARTPPTVDRMMIRYEDLVLDLASLANELSEWLGLSLNAEAVLAGREQNRHHMTSASPKESIGRWRNELSPAEASKIWDPLASEIAAWGYRS